MVIRGRVENGVVVLEGGPVLPEGTEVAVSCALAPRARASPPTSVYLTFGKYKGRMSTLEDFKDAEWHGDDELYGRDGE